MKFKEIFAVYSDNDMKLVCTLSSQNAVLLNPTLEVRGKSKSVQCSKELIYTVASRHCYIYHRLRKVRD